MAYSILLAPPAERQLTALAEPIQKRIVKRLRALMGNPRPQGVKKLAGEEDLYRIREGDYRIIYTIRDKELIVLVLKLATGKRSIVSRPFAHGQSFTTLSDPIQTPPLAPLLHRKSPQQTGSAAKHHRDRHHAWLDGH